VKFGLKPTLRVVQLVTLRGNPADHVAYAIAEKQLYSSRYFETALDLSFCVRGSDDSHQPGFYLIMAMGSEQARPDGGQGFNRSKGRRGPVGFKSPRRTCGHQEHARTQPVSFPRSVNTPRE
jgi:hypothetical protein